MVTRRAFLAATGAVALTAPFGRGLLGGSAFAAPANTGLTLANQGSGSVNAYITGREQGTDRLMLLRADSSPYYLENPSAPQTPIPDCSIPVGAGASADLTLRQMYAARIYFVKNDKLDFYVNPGPGLVEPSFANPADTNYSKVWSFCEFTFNPQQIFANISYVDLLTALPIGLKLEGDSTHNVAAAPAGAVDAIANALVAQKNADGQPWDRLVIRNGGGGVLRVIAPQDYMAMGNGAFANYWDGYVGQVWDKYAGTDLRVDLQGGRGVFTGRVSGGVLRFNDGSTFARPASKDIFTCNDGPFANNPGDSDIKKGLLARIAAAFNRSTILSSADQPNGTQESDFYKDPITNHWARIVHANTPIGYAFPYDDVCPDGQPDVSGAASDGNPRRLTVTVG